MYRLGVVGCGLWVVGLEEFVLFVFLNKVGDQALGIVPIHGCRLGQHR